MQRLQQLVIPKLNKRHGVTLVTEKPSYQIVIVSQCCAYKMGEVHNEDGDVQCSNEGCRKTYPSPLYPGGRSGKCGTEFAISSHTDERELLEAWLEAWLEESVNVKLEWSE